MKPSPASHWKFTALILLGGLLLLPACHKAPANSNSESSHNPRLPAVPVTVVPAQTRTLTHMEEVVGTVRARNRAIVEAKVSGRIAEMPFGLGQEVREGEVLARLDAAEFKARLDQAQATLEQAQRDWDRFSALYKDQVATRSEHDLAEARLRTAKAAVTEAEVMLNYARVVAPFDGVITRKLAEAGDLAAPGKGLLEMETLGALRLEADVPEGVSAGIRVGSSLNVNVGTGAPIRGTVSELAPSADPVSRTFLVKVDLPQVPGLRSGQFGRLLLPAGESQALRVPANALVVRGQLEMLFVITDHHAHMRLVRSGKRVGDEIEILAGLDENDQVAVSGISRLMDGQPVEVQ